MIIFIVTELLLVYLVEILNIFNILLEWFCSINFTLNSHSIPDVYISLLPWFVTGYTDAEGSFLIKISRNPRCKLGWQVKLEFSIGALNNPVNLK